MPPFHHGPDSMGPEEEEPLGRARTWPLLRKFMRFVRPFAHWIALAVAIAMAGAALDLVGPQIIKLIFDGPMVTGDLHQLFSLAGLFLATVAGGYFLDVGMTYLVNWTGQSGMLLMRDEIFAHLQTLDCRFFDKNPVGRLLTRVMNDVAALNDLLSVGIPTIFNNLLTLVGIILILFWTDWRLALVIFFCFPAILAFTFWFSRAVRVYYRQTRTRLAAMNSFLQENLSGMATVQMFGREKKNQALFVERNARYRDAQLGTVVLFALLFPAIEFVFALAVSLILWRGGGRLIHGTITFGTLTAFVMYARRFFFPIRDLAEQFNVFEAAFAAAERIFGLLETQPGIVDPPAPKSIGSFRERIEFDHVWFAYEGEDWVLKDVSFTVERGRTLAIVGATGAGKTTLISLLQRLYDVQRGAIRIDGVDIREMAQQDLRRRLAVVLQDVFLFHGSIGENIRLARPGLTAEEARRAAEVVHADPFIRRLPGGYDQEILERGATLSVGQKQLLAFARALACSPEILVLDEATSNIDTETEALIQDAMRRLLEGRTAIVIAHRLSTIQRADRILVFHHGRLRESGTHDELLRQDGIYRRLCQLQYREALA
ncbi:MAG: ABC transporter ATP-binding protein [Candidatus Sumerlaeota bacterium]|nr:ABC transporter ATP-binding protein [Candidatus Sumerlaeota bacterium]